MDSLHSSLTVVQASGVLNAANAQVWQAQFSAKITDDNTTGLMVDMSQVESLDSAGLVSLISVLRLARDLSKRFCLYAVPPAIHMVFEMTQLDQAFEFVDVIAVQAA